jgi:aminoglycoside 3-N-acetyltransferase
LVVSTATVSLCNTDQVFDPVTTASEMGVFSEFVRLRLSARRSFHPFISYAAVGPLAGQLTENIGRHGFGPCSPKARMIAHDACALSVGIDPRMSCTTVHHVELVSAVPYRYVKEFMHPVQRPSGVYVEPFYLYVWYRDIGIQRDRNRKLFAKLAERDFTISSTDVGLGQIHAYSMRQFYELSLEAFREDPYIWLERLPLSRPYQN